MTTVKQHIINTGWNYVSDQLGTLAIALDSMLTDSYQNPRALARVELMIDACQDTRKAVSELRELTDSNNLHTFPCLAQTLSHLSDINEAILAQESTTDAYRKLAKSVSNLDWLDEEVESENIAKVLEELNSEKKSKPPIDYIDTSNEW